MISLIKRNSCGKALEAARLARDMLGGLCGGRGEGMGGMGRCVGMRGCMYCVGSEERE